MPTDLTITTMTPEERQMALEWTKQEGWNPGLDDAQLFGLADPSGFYIGKLNNDPVSVGSMVNYSPDFAFAGLYIVKPEYRGRGYGMSITHQLLDHAGNRNIGLNAVLANVQPYESIGFHTAYQNLRFKYRATKKQDPIMEGIVSLAQLTLNDILAYDATCFPAPRAAFMQAWINQPQATALGFVENGVIKGFGVCRRCVDGYKVGPLFADTPLIAERLFVALQAGKESQPIFLDMPENNPAAMALAQTLNMQTVFTTVSMYNKQLLTDVNDKIYAITSTELG